MGYSFRFVAVSLKANYLKYLMGMGGRVVEGTGLEILLALCRFVLPDINSVQIIRQFCRSEFAPSVYVPGHATEFGSNFGSIDLFLFSFTCLYLEGVSTCLYLEAVTPHVLRHSFASVAGDLGYSELTIAALLGHAGGSVTAGYVSVVAPQSLQLPLCAFPSQNAYFFVHKYIQAGRLNHAGAHHVNSDLPGFEIKDPVAGEGADGRLGRVVNGQRSEALRSPDRAVRRSHAA